MLLFWLILFLFKGAYTYKIFVYSSQVSHSHVSFMGHIADTLAQAGHDVTVYLPEFSENVTTTGVKISKAIVSKRKFPVLIDQDEKMKDLWSEDSEDPRQLFEMMRLMSKFMSMLCSQQLNEKEMINKFINEKFDLGFGELFDPCSIAFLEQIKVPAHISVFSTNIIESFSTPFGLDSNPSYVPASFSPLSDEMSYIDRAKNLAIYLMTTLCFKLINKPAFDEAVHKYIREDFNLEEKMSQSTFVFVNSEEFTEFPRPISHKFVFIGGIGAKEPKKLDEEFQRVMDESKKGVVLVSFGSIMKSSRMPNKLKNAFIGAFKNFPEVTFIWKYEVQDDVGKDVPNLYKTKWTPQNDLFGHPKLLAFISHGGMNSVTESTHAGIPMVMIPLFGDQMRNSKMAQKRGVAYVLNKKNITSQSLSDALKAVIYDKRYRESANRLSLMINKKPISAKEKVIKYSEFAAQFGQIDNLNLASVKLNFIQYYLIDIIIPALLLLIIIFYFSFKFTLFIFRKFSKIFKSKID